MEGFDFQISIQSSGNPGTSLGSSFLQSASSWRYTTRADRAGTIEFDFLASDPVAEVVQNRRYARADALIGGFWQEVGLGIIDKIETIPGTDGNVVMRASGLDLIGELNRYNTHTLELGAGEGTTLAGALATLNALPGPFTASWIFHQAEIVPNDYFYAQMSGESVLTALIYLAEKTQTHFYRGTQRNLHFTSTFDDSGIHAIRADGQLAPNACAITGLTRTVDTYAYQSRMYTVGAGDDRSYSLSLADTTRAAPAGYTLNKEEGWIENDEASAEHGYVDWPYVDFKEIAPISNTTADYVAASDMLFDTALTELRRRSTLPEQYRYTLSVAGCNQLLRPMQTIRVVYRDPEQNLNIDADLNILEATWEMNTSGIRTSRLVVTTDDQWPKGANDNAVDRAVQGRIFVNHPQQSLNTWEANDRLLVGEDQDDLARFTFILGPEVVTVRQVRFFVKVESIQVAAYRYTLDDETEQNDPANTGETAAEIDPEFVVVEEVAAEIDPETVTMSSETVAVSTEPLSVSITTPTTLGAPSPDSTTGDNLALGDPHQHDFDHTHPVTAEHGHGSLSHAHGTTGHTHTADPHAHSSPLHDHPTQQHAHVSPLHDHTSPQHVHPLPELVETFSLDRVDALTSYVLGDLEYAVNGGEFQTLSVAIPAAEGFFELDLTDDVTDPDVPFRPAQESGWNTIDIRRSTAAGTGKTALVLCKVYVRTTIKGVSIGDA